jgi:hypothetical protein
MLLDMKDDVWSAICRYKTFSEIHTLFIQGIQKSVFTSKDKFRKWKVIW